MTRGHGFNLTSAKKIEINRAFNVRECKNMLGIDLFSGAGGMSLGARMAGIDIRLCIEIDKHALLTYTANHPEATIFSEDIRLFTKMEIGRPNEPLVLFGGPPCQGFSTSNQRTRSSANPNNWLFEEFIRVVTLYMPDWVVFENVKGILETEGGKFFHDTYDSLSGLGYTLSDFILNAADFGVPQSRSRVFIVGNKHGIKLDKPQHITATPVTVWEAIADLPDLCNGASEDRLNYKCDPISDYARNMRGAETFCSNNLVTCNAKHIVERYQWIPQGGNWQNIPQELMSNYADRSRCHTGIYRRLDPNIPSVVIGNFRKNMLIHPYEDRGLSVREAARLQSFPDGYVFKGTIGFQQQQVGNAVPPLLAKAIFDKLFECHNKVRN